MPRTLAFRIALSISVVLHGLIVFVVIQQDYSITLKMTTDEDTFVISLRSSAPTENSKPIEIVEAQILESVAEPRPKTADVGQPAPSAKNQKTVLTPVLKPAEGKAPRLKQSVSSMITAAVEQDSIDAIKASLALGCTPAQRASEVRICGPDDNEVTGQGRVTAFVGTFSKAFRHLSAKSPNFDTDMVMVESLMQRQEELEGMSPAEGLEAAFVAQEQRDIREQIARLESRYQHVNLLKLIPIGAKVVTRLWEAAKSKK